MLVLDRFLIRFLLVFVFLSAHIAHATSVATVDWESVIHKSRVASLIEGYISRDKEKASRDIANLEKEYNEVKKYIDDNKGIVVKEIIFRKELEVVEIGKQLKDIEKLFESSVKAHMKRFDDYMRSDCARNVMSYISKEHDVDIIIPKSSIIFSRCEDITDDIVHKMNEDCTFTN